MPERQQKVLAKVRIARVTDYNLRKVERLFKQMLNPVCSESCNRYGAEGWQKACATIKKEMDFRVI